MSPPVPTWRLAAVVALSAVLVAAMPVAQPAGLLLVAIGVVGLALFDWAVTARPDAVEIGRKATSALVLDQRASTSWTVLNRHRRSLAIAFSDELHPALGARQRRFALRLAPGATATITTELHPTRRGRFDASDVDVRVSGPLGLMARQARRDMPMTYRVYPPFRSREEAEIRIRKARVLEVGMRSARGRGGGTDFDQIRDYSTDDEFRRIDWAATARAGRAMVRTYRAERNQSVVCLLDNGRTMAGTIDGVARVEHAMDAVMALTVVATGLGDRCGLMAFDRDIRAVVPPARHPAQLGRVSEALYDLQPALVETDYSSAFTHMLARFRRRTMLVVLTDLDEEAMSQTLLPALPLIARSHVLIVASIRDPDVDSWATEPPTDQADAHRRAAAVLSIEARRRASARLGAYGAHVIDEAPGRLPGRLADVYLDVKAVGAL